MGSGSSKRPVLEHRLELLSEESRRIAYIEQLVLKSSNENTPKYTSSQGGGGGTTRSLTKSSPSSSRKSVKAPSSIATNMTTPTNGEKQSTGLTFTEYQRTKQKYSFKISELKREMEFMELEKDIILRLLQNEAQREQKFGSDQIQFTTGVDA